MHCKQYHSLTYLIYLLDEYSIERMYWIIGLEVWLKPEALSSNSSPNNNKKKQNIYYVSGNLTRMQFFFPSEPEIPRSFYLQEAPSGRGEWRIES
jgi:hypothetical protein